MSISKNISSCFPENSLKLSESGKLIKEYDKTSSSEDLFNFINFHPSIRVVFNAFVKKSFESSEKVIVSLQNLMRETKTSLIYEAKCDCGNILGLPHIYELKEISFPEKKRCGKCKKFTRLMETDYQFNYDVNLRDLHETCYKGHPSVFTVSPVKECFECGDQFIAKKDSKFNASCNNCSSLAYISMQIFPCEDLKKLIESQQGYWLEWYVWRLIRDEFKSEVGIKINNKYEADLIVVHNKKKIFIECKDTSDSSLLNLHQIKKDFDFYIFISTHNFKKAQIENAKQVLKEKFIQITPAKIEEVVQTIKKLN